MDLLYLDKALIAYLWDDAPPQLKESIPTGSPPPQMLMVAPARWGQRAAMEGVPLALATVLGGYAGKPWGRAERFHQPDGSVLIVLYKT